MEDAKTSKKEDDTQRNKILSNSFVSIQRYQDTTVISGPQILNVKESLVHFILLSLQSLTKG